MDTNDGAKGLNTADDKRRARRIGKIIGRRCVHAWSGWTRASFGTNHDKFRHDRIQAIWREALRPANCHADACELDRIVQKGMKSTMGTRTLADVRS